MVLIELSLLLFWCIMLAVSGSFLVKSLTKISKFLRLEEFSVGFIIMAIATSIPEIFVGISSAIAKTPSLSLGNVVGSNIVDLTLVGGIIILLSGRKIKIKNKEIRKDSFLMSMITLIPILLIVIDGSLSQLEGIFLIIVFGLYMRKKIVESRRFSRRYEKGTEKKEIFITVAIFLISFIILFLSSKFIVIYAETISTNFFLPPILIGLILVSVGTSLPELVFGTKASLSGHPELSLGDITGSVVVNSTLVLGITAIIYPITTNLTLFLTAGFFMFIITFLFASFVESGGELDWKEGCSLIFLYVFFLILEIYLKFIPLG